MWSDVLRQTEHRPWPLPTGQPAMTMTWRNLLFAHWPLPPDALRSKIPPSLELETFDGAAWIGIVPFEMRNVGPYRIPRTPWRSAFPELNVRTYVRAGDHSGVFFFSLDAANPVAVRLARRWFYLPYFNARMSVLTDGEWIDYRSERRHRGFPGGEFLGRYRPSGEVRRSTSGTLDHWLTERYCLYSVDRAGRARRGDINHAPWPLQPAIAEIGLNSVVDAHGIVLPDLPPLLHFAKRLDVLAWRPVLVGNARD
jgi:uncharacterized protein YqjF (DUF2071 family)